MILVDPSHIATMNNHDHGGAVHDLLLQALEPVIRDIQATGIAAPDVREHDYANLPEMATALMWSQDGSGMGVSVLLDRPESARIAMVADQVQEWVIEELWRTRRSTNWPPCSSHPGTHPLAAEDQDGVAVWACPDDGTPVSPIGLLGSLNR
jgi:hypothetical protein